MSKDRTPPAAERHAMIAGWDPEPYDLANLFAAARERNAARSSPSLAGDPTSARAWVTIPIAPEPPRHWSTPGAARAPARACGPHCHPPPTHPNPRMISVGLIAAVATAICAWLAPSWLILVLLCIAITLSSAEWNSRRGGTP